jgi:hypothetical protein
MSGTISKSPRPRNTMSGTISKSPRPRNTMSGTISKSPRPRNKLTPVITPTPRRAPEKRVAAPALTNAQLVAKKQKYLAAQKKK